MSSAASPPAWRRARKSSLRARLPVGVTERASRPAATNASSRAHPRDGLGAGKGVKSGVRAEFFPDGVLPDVCGGNLDGLVWAKNVIVIAHLPKNAMMGSAVFKGRALFDEANKFAEISGIIHIFGQDM